ncbi:MAG: PHP domain-containing protein [Bradymonadia bacterium]
MHASTNERPQSYPVDLHAHSTCSDGALSPQALVQKAAARGVRIFALTDHDTTVGIPAAMEAAEPLGVTIVPGVEISAHHEREVHVLGYFIDPEYPELKAIMATRKLDREERVRTICARLKGLGMPLDAEGIIRHAGGNVGRPHVARAMVFAGYVKTFDEAFKRFLGSNKPAYVAASYLPVSEAIAMIHRAGGLAVVAHPCADNLARAIPTFAEWGLDGVEVYHPAHHPGQRRALLKLCEVHDLVVTGGTDFHGPDGDPPGTFGLEPQVFEAMLARRQQRQLVDPAATKPQPSAS